MNRILLISSSENDLARLILRTAEGTVLLSPEAYSAPEECFDAVCILGGDRDEPLRLTAPVRAAVERLRAEGYTLVGEEPLKLTVATRPYGYEGDAIADKMREHGIECEFADPDHIVFMLTPEIGEEGLCRLEEALLSVEKKEADTTQPPKMPRPERVISPREALLSPAEECAVEEAEGRILANPTVSCPPAVPVAVCGERIDEAAIRCFQYYGITRCRVVKE